MLGQEDNNSPPLPPHAAAAGRKTYSRSVSWAGSGSSPVKSNPNNPKSLWNTKARACLPPLSVFRPKSSDWPVAGSDDLGVWPNITATTPGARPKPENNPEFEFKKDKLTFFDKECSRITTHIFLGSDSVAKNRSILRENNITHVLNCVGFVCPEYFKNDLVYKTLWLRDSPSEDITSILYDVFDYFEDVRVQNGHVLVHCCHGISRSASLVIAYLMWSNGQTFENALDRVKAARGVTNPNMGFACQLLQCQKRIHAGTVSPGSVPRMFRMAPHSSYAPLHLVPKLLTQPNSKALDSRGAFIVHVANNIYIWIGKNCVPLMSETASLAASQVVRYEKVNGRVSTVKEGEEPVEFWRALVSEKQKQETENKYVVDYDLDFEIFYMAANGGVVPPVRSEMRLPVKQSGWDLITTDYINNHKDFQCLESPDSFLESSRNQDDNFECHSPDSFSCFRVENSRKFVSLSPLTSEYSSSCMFSPTSSNWSDSSNSDQMGQTRKNLVKSWSFLEDRSIKDVEEITERL